MFSEIFHTLSCIDTSICHLYNRVRQHERSGFLTWQMKTEIRLRLHGRRHPAIMNELLSTNMMQTSGYGLDEFSESARDKIRECGAPNAEVYLLVGGTRQSYRDRRASPAPIRAFSVRRPGTSQPMRPVPSDSADIKCSRCPIHMERSQPPRSPLIWILFYLMIIMSTWLCRVWSISPSLRNNRNPVFPGRTDRPQRGMP